MKNFIEKIKGQKDLSIQEVQQAMALIVSGEAAREDIKSFLLALKAKGPTVEEITGAAKLLREFSLTVKTKHKTILDTCGTGGDRKDTFNISTITAFVVAGAGVVVAKHGNRSVTSQCGSADLLEALGINITIEQKYLSECLDQIGIVFLFAQKLHPAMKNVAAVRKELGVETIFNILGPLMNPAKATHQMMGVYNRDYVEPMAHVLKNLGLKRALVVHGSDGLDEITTTAKTFVSEFNGREVISYDIEPAELGIPLASPGDLTGGNLEKNAAIAMDIFNGKLGAKRDIVVLNAGYALYTAQKVKNIKEGIKLANVSIDSGQAKGKLEALKNFTNH